MKTKKIIAIGGGEIGRPGTQIETESIDREIIRLTGKLHPKLVFLPTATGDSEGYIEVIQNYFGKRLGCKVDSLLLKKQKYSVSEIRKKLLESDIIYVGGGNTLKMMKLWRKLGVDNLLREAYSAGKVLSGVSAGSICWFNYGQSDSWKTKENPNAPFIQVEGLGLINALHAPHFTREPERHESFRLMTKRTPGIAIALEDCVALEVVDDKYRILVSKHGRKAYKCYWTGGKYHQEEIMATKEFRKLGEL